MKYLLILPFLLALALPVSAKEINVHAEWTAEDDDKIGFTLFLVRPDGSTTIVATGINPLERQHDFTFDVPMGKTNWYIQSDYPDGDPSLVDMGSPYLFKLRGGPPKLNAVLETP